MIAADTLQKPTATLAIFQMRHKARLERIAMAAERHAEKVAEEQAARARAEQIKILEQSLNPPIDPYAVAWSMIEGVESGVLRPIQNIVAEDFGLSREMMISHRRTAGIV